MEQKEKNDTFHWVVQFAGHHILVLDKGHIAQQGTHKELMKEKGLYRKFIDVREKAIGWRQLGEV